jgi:hypothetical protein
MIKHLFFILLIFPVWLYAQESEYRVLSEKKIDDNLILQTASLTIFNNTDKPLCLKLSTSFREKILGKDTIRLAAMTNDTLCQYFKLWISDQSKRNGFRNFRSYPLVLNSKGSFTATISIVLNLNCKNTWLEYRYINQRGINYCDFSKRFSRKEKWDANPRLKFHSLKITVGKKNQG